jgi:hypothetical protein
MKYTKIFDEFSGTLMGFFLKKILLLGHRLDRKKRSAAPLNRDNVLQKSSPSGQQARNHHSPEK